MTPAWSAGEVDARHAVEHWPELGVRLAIRRSVAVLPPELVRSLAHWLLWAVGDRDQPVDPDAVRVAVDEQRQVLHERHAAGVTPEAATELAWAHRALDAIAAAASHTSERRP